MKQIYSKFRDEIQEYFVQIFSILQNKILEDILKDFKLEGKCEDFEGPVMFQSASQS